MRVVVSVQAKRESSRGLIHYIAHSKVDPAREPQAREIFNAYADAVPVEKANEFLKNRIGAKKPANDELHHLVISLKLEDYDRLGADEAERAQSLKRITRHAMRALEKSIGADKLTWAAGIHRNTDHPHVHVAVSKRFFDKNFEKKTLLKIPGECLPGYEKNGSGKTFAPGVLIATATEKLDEILTEKAKVQSREQADSREQKEPTRSARNDRRTAQNQGEKTFAADIKSNAEVASERDVLARALLAKFHLEKTRENLESLENHGDKRRFKIFDEITGKNRRMSLFDLERRAEKGANREIKNLKITDAAKRDERRKILIESEMQKNSVGIKRIRTILHNLIVKENRELKRRENDYHQIKPMAEKIRRDCQLENRKLPVPNLTRDELEMLQARSLEQRDVRAANYFERVRAELADERRQPTRTNEEIARLKALRTLSELKILSQEKQSKDLSSGKRAFPVELDGRKWSLKRADEMIKKRQADERKLVGKISKAFGKIGLIEQPETAAKLEKIKDSVAEKLREKAEQLASETKSEKSIFKTLDEFYKADTNPEKERVEANLTAAELAEIESLAFELKLPEIYRDNWRAQKQFVERGAGGGESKNSAESIAASKQKTIAGRAVAREIMCGVEEARAKEEIAAFKKHKNFHKFEITSEKTGESKFVSLKEVEFDARGSIFDQTLEFFVENREKRRARHQVQKQVKEKEFELKENLKAARSLTKIASEEMRDYKTKSFFGAISYAVAPVFTPKELVTIELRIRQTENKTEAANLQKLLHSADHSAARNLAEVLVSYAAKNEFSRAAETDLSKEQKTARTADQNEPKPETHQVEVRENKTRAGDAAVRREIKTENHDQEKTR